MERIARILMAAASGAVLSLIVAAVLPVGAWGLVACMVGLAVVLAAAQARSRSTEKPASPRAAQGAALTGVALLLALAVLMGQALYVQISGRAETPLPIWPLTSKVLWLALGLAVAGFVLGAIGWDQQRQHREEFGGGRLALMAILGALATAALALICYLSGYGFPFGR